jgi:hypothetical protein
MRLIKVSAPAGKGSDVAQVAFSAGIKEVSIQPAQSLSSDGKSESKDAIDIQTSTPKGKRFIDGLISADFYNSDDYSIAIRQPRSIVSSESLHEITKPLVEPSLDIIEELWQFSHITVGFVGRIFIAACFLAYGLIQQQTLIIIAGLLFLPLLPTLLAISFGIWTRNFRLAGQGALAFLTAAVLLFLGGVAVALSTSPPIKYNEFNPLLVSVLISAAVGVAGVLANTDDVGRRELIGLAATAQIAIIPTWFGISSIFGFSVLDTQNEISTRAIAFGVNLVTIITAALITYILLGYKSKKVT